MQVFKDTKTVFSLYLEEEEMTLTYFALRDFVGKQDISNESRIIINNMIKNIDEKRNKNGTDKS